MCTSALIGNNYNRKDQHKFWQSGITVMSFPNRKGEYETSPKVHYPRSVKVQAENLLQARAVWIYILFKAVMFGKFDTNTVKHSDKS